MNRLRGQPLGKTWQEKQWRQHMELLSMAVRPFFLSTKGYLPIPDLQNLNNMLCEFDKLERYRESRKTSKKIGLRRYRPVITTAKGGENV
jgi:hypothetical protein